MIATDSAADVVDVSALDLQPDALRRVPRELALRHDILSLASDGNQLTIALPFESDSDAIDRIRFATGMHVRAVRAPRDIIRARLFEAYTDARQGDSAQRDSRGRSDSPAVRLLDDIHEAALCDGASDVHLEPLHTGGRVRQRVDGMLVQMREMPEDLFAQVSSRVKLLAGMDIADRRQPQDGRYSLSGNGRAVDARVSSMPTIAGEKLVIRLLDNSARVPEIERLGMPEECLRAFRTAARSPHGFIVVCGPTGSGKTTTLYAALAERDLTSENLCSVEDPVEIAVPGIAQVQVNARAGVTFASAVRGLLRQDPNVLMIGEMRDEETAAVASSAALTGQLVLTTLHSIDAPTAVDRLRELGVARHTQAATLTAIVAQRLVRRLCRECRVPQVIDSGVATAFSIAPGSHAFRAGGCDDCSHTGYAGRIAIFEAIFPDDAVRSLIAEGQSGVTIAEAAGARRYRRMLENGIARVLAGDTTFEEIGRVLPGTWGR